MAYSAVPTVATGDAWSAAQHNTYIRGNFTAAWPYTTAGDMVYATSSTALARLPIGTSGQILQVSSGSPAWGTIPNFNMCYLKRTTAQTITSGTYTDISFDTEVVDTLGAYSAGSPTYLTTPVNGLYRFTVNVNFAGTNGSGVREATYYFDFGQKKNALITTLAVEISFSGYEYIDASKNTTISVYQNSGVGIDVTASMLLELIG